MSDVRQEAERLPWRVAVWKEHSDVVDDIVDAEGNHVVCFGHDYDDSGTMTLASAEAIVRAVNERPTLLAKLAAHEQEIVRLRWCLMEAEFVRDAALAEVARLTLVLERLRPWDVPVADWQAAIDASRLTTP